MSKVNIVIIIDFIYFFFPEDIDKNGSELETKKPQNKRKRLKENDEVISGGEDESMAKKSRCQSSSSSGRL